MIRKRVLSIFAVLVMLFALLPIVSRPAYAAAKAIDNVQITVTAPTAGSKSTAKPNVKLPSGANYEIEWSSWLDPSTGAEDPAAFTFESGKTYRFGVTLKANSGYYISDSAKITVTGGTVYTVEGPYTFGEYSAVAPYIEVKVGAAKKAANPIQAKGSTKSIKYSLLKTQNKTYTAKNAFTVTKNQGKLTYAKTKGNSKITVSSAGKVTVKKGLKRGTYAVKVKITAAGNTKYKAGSKTVTLTIKVV